MHMASILHRLSCSLATPPRKRDDDGEARLGAAAQRICRARAVVAFTGAGISADSGISTYRATSREASRTGLWDSFESTVGLFVFSTPLGFLFAPDRAWSLYCERLLLPIARAHPNAGHRALAELGRVRTGVTIITQNIDGLHQRAGADDVIEVHGTVSTHRHAWTGRRVLIDDPQLCDPSTLPQRYTRPDVILFGEGMPTAWWEADAVVEDLGAEDVMLVVGTSCAVQPAGSLPQRAIDNGCHVIEINLEPNIDHDTGGAQTTFLQGGASEVLPALLARILAGLEPCAQHGRCEPHRPAASNHATAQGRLRTTRSAVPGPEVPGAPASGWGSIGDVSVNPATSTMDPRLFDLLS